MASFTCEADNDRFWQSIGKIAETVLSVMVVLLCLYVRWRLLDLPFERDEGEYAYIGQLLLQGVPPYLEAYTLKLPGVSSLYALFMLIFGQNASSIHLGLLLVNLGSILLVGLLARRLFEAPAAPVAMACYALLSLSQGVAGAAAHATHFVVLFALAGFLLLLRHFDAGRLWPLLGSGICLGLAITMKQHAVFLAAFAVGYYAWCARRHPVAGMATFAAGSLFLFAIALPLLLVVVGVALAGTFDQFWFWTVCYAVEYSTRLTLVEGATVFVAMFGKILEMQLLWWLLAMAGGLLILLRPHLCRDRALLLGMLLSSLLAVSAGFYFRGHYFIMLLPSMSLLAAAAVTAADTLLVANSWPHWLRRSVPLLLLIVCAGYGIYQERVYLLLPPDRVSRAIYDVNPFPESPIVARYLQEHTVPTDRVAVLGSEPQIYFYADRRSASRHIYMYGLVEPHRYAESMQRELIEDIETAQPKYLVFVGVPASWLISKKAPQALFEWVDGYLEQNYLLEGMVDIGMDRTVYNFDPATEDANLTTNASLMIYRRKT